MLGARAASRQKRNSFTSNWDTTQAGSANDTIDLKSSNAYPLNSNGSYNFKIYWGDGTTDIITAYNQTELTHQYVSTGTYEIRIGGEISGWRFNTAGDDDKIIEIYNWGPLIVFQTSAFEGCSNLKLTATDTLITPINSYEIFRLCPNIGSEGNMNPWDTSNTTNMSYMFYESNSLNQPLGNWDTSSVTNMSAMFHGSLSTPHSIFDQDLGNWDVGSVQNMLGMFTYARNFNNGGSTGINDWDTSNVTDMTNMFYDAINFNQPIGDWDTSSVTTMNNMFHRRRFGVGNSFDQDLGAWDVGNVTNMQGMFGAHSPSYTCPFNNGGSPSISGWNTSNNTSLYRTFMACTGFNQPIGAWDTSNVTNMSQAFYYAKSFNNGGSPNISGWNTSNVTNMKEMFHGDSNTSNPMTFNQPLDGWDVTGVTTMRGMFTYAKDFNNGGSTGINNWRPSSCTDMANMFYDAINFNQPIGDWDTSSVTTMNNMFHRRRFGVGNSFDQDLGAWDVGNVTNMQGMFGAHSVNLTSPFNNNGSPSISGWDTSNVTTMYRMFRACTGFNQPIGAWDTSSLTNMASIFEGGSAGAMSFNQDIGHWQTSGVTSMSNVFAYCTGFNNGGSPSISGWDTSNVTNMSNMFADCKSFNQPIQYWDVSNVTTMGGMFFNRYHTSVGNPVFNQPIGQWNTSSLTDIGSMLRGYNNNSALSSFDQDLGNWIVTGITNASQFMQYGDGLSTCNYDRTLSGWHSQAVQNGVNINFAGSQYSSGSQSFRDALVASGWTITDGGMASTECSELYGEGIGGGGMGGGLP